VKSVSVQLLRGKVRIQGLRVCNPCKTLGVDDDFAWRSECILKVDELLFDIDVPRLATSLGQVFDIEEIVLHGAHAYVEKPSLTELSNIRLVVDFIGKGSTGDKTPSPRRSLSRMAEESPKSTSSAGAKGEQKKKGGGVGPEVRIRKVSIEDLGATAIPPPHFGTGFAVQLGDINFDDLSERMQNKSGAAYDVIAILLNTILSTVAANTHTALARRMMSGGGSMQGDRSPPQSADTGRSWQLGAAAAALCRPVNWSGSPASSASPSPQSRIITPTASGGSAGTAANADMPSDRARGRAPN